MCTTPVADFSRARSCSGSIIIGVTQPVIAVGVGLGLESIVVVVFGTVAGGVSILSTFPTDSFVLLLCSGHKSFIFL